MSENIIDLQAWKGTLETSHNGGPKKNLTNLMIHLKNVATLGNKIRWNELTQEAEWNGEAIADHHLLDIRLAIESSGFEPAVRDVYGAVLRHARSNAYHPIRSYLDALEWDGVPRLDTWLHDHLGAPDSKYVSLVGAKTLIAAVARVREPGCKVDTMLILEGAQGIKKSSAIAALFSEGWSTESVNLFDAHNKMVLSMTGSWVVELAEFTAVAKRDANTVKGLLSASEDRVVLPYARSASEHPRQCVFIGTINPGDAGYLTDVTGNRRFWPVAVREANIDQIREQRDQLWAEASQRYEASEAWWLEGEEQALLARSEAAQREEADPWDEVLAVAIDRDGTKSLTGTDALHLIGVLADRMDTKAQKRVTACLRRLGWKSQPRKRTTEDGGRESYRVYVRAE